MPKQRILHLSTLVEKGACSEQVELFRELFGESVIVTEKRAVSVADKFNWNWAARHLLSQTASDEYNRTRQVALDEYNRITQPAWDEYNRTIQTASDEYYRTIQPAWDEYYKTIQAAWDEYSRTTQPAWDEYNRITQPAWDKYNITLARTFANLYINNTI